MLMYGEYNLTKSLLLVWKIRVFDYTCYLSGGGFYFRWQNNTNNIHPLKSTRPQMNMFSYDESASQDRQILKHAKDRKV